MQCARVAEGPFCGDARALKECVAYRGWGGWEQAEFGMAKFHCLWQGTPKRQREKSNFRKFAGATKQPKQQFWGCSGAHGSGYKGPAATTWAPWVLKYLHCHQMVTQTHPRGDRTVSGKVEF